MDPQSLQIVDTFNLDHPFPVWAAQSDAQTIYIFHKARSQPNRSYESGISRLDITTGEETFIPTPGVPFAAGMDVYQDQPCLTQDRSEGGGLWCLNFSRELELKVPQKYAVGVLFRPSAPGS